MDQTPETIRRRLSQTNLSLGDSRSSAYSADLTEEILRLEAMQKRLEGAQEALAQSIAIWFDYGEGNHEAEVEVGYEIAQIITNNLVDMGWVIIPSTPDWED